MSMFTLALSCLTTSNLPWFMDLTFQVPMQYCSLQHQTLLPTPVTSTTGCCFYFGSISSFFLELFLHWSPVACWASTNLGSSSFSVLFFSFFILFVGFSWQEYWSGLPFPSPVDHILSDLSTMTRPSWVAAWAWFSFIELDNAVVLVWLGWLVFCEYGFSVSALWCPRATPTVLLGFLLPLVWGISTRLLQQSAANAPYLGPTLGRAIYFISLLILHVNLRDSSPRWLHRRLLNSPFPMDMSKHPSPCQDRKNRKLIQRNDS